MLRSRSAVLALAALVIGLGAADARAARRNSYSDEYSVDGLGLGDPVAPNSPQYKRYKCETSEQYEASILCTLKENKEGVTHKTTILHSPSNIALYINRSVSPAFFSIKDIETEIGRLSKRFGKPRQVLYSSQGLIAIWGNIELLQLSSADLSTLAHGGNPKRGFMVDYLGNFGESARSGLPVYRLGGGRGFVWIASLGSGARQSALRFFAADPSQMPHVTGGEPQQGGNDNPSPRVEPPRRAETPRQDEHAGLTTGTGFFVSAAGHIVTNAHVVEGCSKPLVVAGLAAPSLARVAARDAKNDLALIVSDVKPTSVAKLRIGVKTGESIAAFGYPLTGVLSTSGNFTAGNVSAVAGLEDDTRFIQISAPVQPGNSGGPLLDQSANVVGVVTGKLNALKFAEAMQDVPQNVNFAIKTTLLINFLEANGVSYVMGDAGPALAYAELAERGRSMSALIECGEPGLMR